MKNAAIEAVYGRLGEEYVDDVASETSGSDQATGRGRSRSEISVSRVMYEVQARCRCWVGAIFVVVFGVVSRIGRC